jgi:hypothetical protein
MSESPKRATFQIVVDAHGAPLEMRLLYYLQSLVLCVLGAERCDKSYWVTQTDILYDFMGREPQMQFIDPTRNFHEERFHERSMDLYLLGETVPVGRIVNFKEWNEKG